MSYKVIHYFTDLQDFNHPYRVGDSFPRLGMKVSDARLKELSTKANKQGKPLIELVTEPKLKIVVEQTKQEPQESEYTKTMINRMSTAELQSLASGMGVADAEDKIGSELKKVLIKYFNL